MTSLVRPLPRRALPPTPTINLLPEAVRAAGTARRRLRRWAGAVAGAAALTGVAWLVLQQDAVERNQLSGLIASEQAQLRTEQATANALAKETAALAAQRQALGALQRPCAAAELIGRAAAAVPAQAVLTSVRLVSLREVAPVAGPDQPGRGRTPAAAAEPARAAPKGGCELRLSGVVRDASLLSQFVRELQGLNAFAQVDLLQSSMSQLDGQALVQFEVICRR